MESERKFIPKGLTVQHVGKRIKSTKIRYTWEFTLNSKPYAIDLFISRLSGKRIINVNGAIFANEKKTKNSLAKYFINIGNSELILNELRENFFDLFVNNISFDLELNKLKLERANPLRREVRRKEHAKENEVDADINERMVEVNIIESGENDKVNEYIYKSPPISNHITADMAPKGSSPAFDAFNSHYQSISWGQGKFK